MLYASLDYSLTKDTKPADLVNYLLMVSLICLGISTSVVTSLVTTTLLSTHLVTTTRRLRPTTIKFTETKGKTETAISVSVSPTPVTRNLTDIETSVQTILATSTILVPTITVSTSTVTLISGQASIKSTILSTVTILQPSISISTVLQTVPVTQTATDTEFSTQTIIPSVTTVSSLSTVLLTSIYTATSTISKGSTSTLLSTVLVTSVVSSISTVSQPITISETILSTVPQPSISVSISAASPSTKTSYLNTTQLLPTTASPAAPSCTGLCELDAFGTLLVFPTVIVTEIVYATTISQIVLVSGSFTSTTQSTFVASNAAQSPIPTTWNTFGLML
jgi:hypothetical protein